MPFGYLVYFTERSKNRVLSWNPDTGATAVVAGDSSDPAQKLRSPYGLGRHAHGDLLIADKLHNRICRLKDGKVETVATRDNSRQRTHARPPRAKDYPDCPTSIFVERGGSFICAYSDDETIYRVRANGDLELLFGLPPNRPYMHTGLNQDVQPDFVSDAPLNQPTGVVKKSDGSVYWIERGYQTVRFFHPDMGMRLLFSPSSAGKLPVKKPVPDTVLIDDFYPLYPTSLALDSDETIFLADAQYRCVWEVDPQAGKLYCAMRTDVAPDAKGGGPSAVAFGADGILWVLDSAEGAVVGCKKNASGKWTRISERLGIYREGTACAATEGAGIVCI